MLQSHLRSRAPARRRLAFPALIAALALIMVGDLASPQFTVSAAIAPTVLGTAQSFAVLGGSTVTNTGSTVVTGANLGVSPGTAVTGFPPGIVVAPGTIHKADAVAAQAQSDVTTAYNTLAGQARSATLTGQNLGGKTLTQGVYFFATSAQLTGQLILDAQGDPTAVFVFQIGSTLTTASNSSVLLINGASPCNVYWQVGSSATLGTTTAFVGNILALTSIGLNTGATVIGRALARNGAATLDSNTFVLGSCAPVVVPPVAPPVVVPPVVPPVTPPVVTPPVVTPPVVVPPIAPPIVVPPVVPPVVVPPVTPPGGGVPGSNGSTGVTGSVSSPPATAAVTGTPDTSTPISATLPFVGTPANAAATPIPATGTPNMPIAPPRTGGGGEAKMAFVRRLGDG